LWRLKCAGGGFKVKGPIWGNAGGGRGGGRGGQPQTGGGENKGNPACYS